MPNLEPDELRQAAIDRLHLLIYRSDETLIRITRLAAHGLDAPYAGFSVLGQGDQEYVATYGFDDETMPWADTLCSVCTLNDELLNVSDTLEHADFVDLPVVNTPGGTRFYVGTPVRSPDNWVIGVFCIFGPEPRVLKDRELDDLQDYARLIEESLLMRSAALRDELTGLYNRRYLSEQLDRDWRRAMRELMPITFVMFDLDHFKQFNDCQGHAAGDAVLVELAEIFRDTIQRPGDTIARVGGEEFLGILPCTNAQQAEGLVQRVLAAVRGRQIEHPEAPSGHITISAGVVTVSSHEQIKQNSPDHFLAMADKALYLAKSNGRDQMQAYCEGLG